MLLIAHQRILLAVILIGSATVADAMLGPLLVPFVRDDLGGNAATYGWMAMFTGVGGILGAILAGRLAAQVAPLRPVVVGLLSVGAVALVRYNVIVLPVAFISFFVGGLGAACWNVARQTILQSETPDGYRGRVFGASRTNSSLMLLLGTTVATVLFGPVGVRPLLNVSAVL